MITANKGSDVPRPALGFSQTYFRHTDPPRTRELVTRWKFS